MLQWFAHLHSITFFLVICAELERVVVSTAVEQACFPRGFNATWYAKRDLCTIISDRGTIGSIVLFVPPNFRGAIQIRVGWGAVEFLPTFANQVRVINGNDQESLLLFNHVGDTFTEADLETETMDICLLSSRAGRIVVGVAGQDHYEPVNVGKSVLKKWRNMWGEVPKEK